MKILIIFIVLSFVFCLPAFAQVNPLCPKISVDGPDDFAIGPSYIFKVKVEGPNLDKINYFWAISAGRIITGRTTPKLTVLSKNGESITATVEIKGIPDNCPKTASATYIIEAPPPPRSTKIDEFSLPSSQIDTSKIDNLLNQISDDSTSKGYILEKFEKNTPLLQVEQKFSQLIAYLKVKNFPADRINVFIINGNENLTELWITPKGAAPWISKHDVQINLQNYKKDLIKLFASKRKNISK